MPDPYVLKGIGGSPLDPDLFAVQVAGGRVTRTWTRSQWGSGVGGSIQVLDVAGASVLPGIDDSHLHGYEFGRAVTALDLRPETRPGLVDLQEALRTAEPEANGWIRGLGWDDSRIAGSGPGGQLCAADLDAARADVPMILTDVTGHQAVCNTIALRLAGLHDRPASGPAGGVIVRDDWGRPTGLLREAAVALVNDVLPPIAIADKVSAIRAAQERLLASGVTAYTDPGLGPGARTLMDGTGDLEAVEAYRLLDSSGDLHVRVEVMLLFGGLGGTRADDVAAGLDQWGTPSRMPRYGNLGIAQVKVFADGIPRSRTAWMHEPYDDCTHGHLTVAGDTDDARVAELRAIVRQAAGRGWQVGVHTTGDRATEVVVDAMVEPDAQAAELRHYIIHGDFTPIATLERMANAGISLNANPSIRWMIGDGVDGIIGSERGRSRQALRTAWELGVNVCSSSDAPVAPPDWRMMVAAAVSRATRTHPKASDEQGLSMREALLSLTRNPARQGHAETWRGSINTGMVADLVVMDGPIDADEPWALPETPVRATIVGGHVRYGTV